MAVIVNIRGKEFPLCLTVAALDALNDKCGGIGGIMDFLRGDPADTSGMTEAQAEKAKLEALSRARCNNAWMLGLLVQEGEENRLIEARFDGGGGQRRAVPGPEEMPHLLTPGQIEGYRLSVLLAVNEGMRRKLEAVPSKKRRPGRGRGTLCSAWLSYWGMSFGLSRHEALHIRLGEMLDLMAAHAIASGAAEEKRPAVTGWDAAMRIW